nr:unnamed protein product [Spirometra erinaceieuropaei]
MDEDGDGYVFFGEPFEEESEDPYNSLKRRVQPQAYEKRVLNEKGRPQRFHGAFTGGFSAGYFNSVGSKEGFQPKSFSSSRRNRENAEPRKQAEPEDFMDEEDLGEFGIAPRRYRTRHEFDDTHIFDAISDSLGGSSIIPAANDILKRMMVSSGTSLSERLLRRFGWKHAEADEQQARGMQRSDGDGDSEGVAEPGEPGDSEFATTTTTSKKQATKAELDYAVISFEPKTNTFGLGYSGLDPRIAFGQKSSTAYQDPRGESVSALRQREMSRRMGADGPGFNPGMGVIRDGIRGQAFGVGALHSEDADIYTVDNLSSYDFSIGDPNEEQEEDGSAEEEEDSELAELEAARIGKFSDQRKRSAAEVRKPKKTIYGWTAPRRSHFSISGDSEAHVLAAFCPPKHSNAALVVTTSPLFVLPKPIDLPPGYSPVFHPACIRGVTTETKTSPQADQMKPPPTPGNVLHAIGRTGDQNSVLTPKQFTPPVSVTRTTAFTAPTTAVASTTPQLLKPFIADPAKQARFDAYQILRRRGFTHENAYRKCAEDQPGLSPEQSVLESEAFSALLKINETYSQTPPPPPPNPTQPTTTSTGTEPQSNQQPLSAGLLDPAKQKLVSNLLKSRFRSAGMRDISAELTEAQENQNRKEIEALDMTDPRDNAAANDSYGVLTRRKLTWHPAALLCKRVNVPNPYPDSTFVGCPEERRFHRVPRLRRRRLEGSTDSFSLFHILDVNAKAAGLEGEQSGSSEEDEELEPEEEKSVVGEQDLPKLLAPQQARRADASGTIFDALFAAAESRRGDLALSVSAEVAEVPPPPSTTTATVKEEAAVQPIVGPARPPPSFPLANPVRAWTNATTEEEEPSMDLFKSIFASDEELEPSDTEDPATEPEQPPSSPHSGIHQEVHSLELDRDLRGREDKLPIHSIESAPADEPEPSVDSSVHQIFKHLFNPQLDSETPLFAVSAVAQQRSGQSVAQTAAGSPSADEVCEGPPLPPGYGKCATVYNFTALF